MVMFAPGGLIGLIVMHAPIWRSGPAARADRALPARAWSAGAADPAGLRRAGRAAVVPHHRRGAGQDVRAVRPRRSTSTAPLPWLVALAAAWRSAACGCGAKARGFRARLGRPDRRRQAAGSRVVSAPARRADAMCARTSARPRSSAASTSTSPRGERHAIIGPNGAGKTTLFNLISGRFPLTSGTIALNGKPIDDLPPQRDQPARPVAQLPDHLDLPAHDGVREHPLRPAVVARLPLLVLAPAGPAEGAERGDRGAAGGPQPRGRGATCRPACCPMPSSARWRSASRSPAAPSVILLDEPTAGMSHSETDYAVALIRRVTEGKTLVMVEHDMSVVFDLADRITVLVYGEVIASDAPAAIRANARRAGSLSRGGGGMMLEVRDLHAYYGKSHILQGVDLTVGEGEIVSLLGRNGVGRSTTCKAIMGLVPPQGAIALQAAGRSPACAPTRSRTPASATCRRTARSFPTLTVRQNLELGLKRAGAFGRWNFDDVFRLFPNLGERQRQSGRRAVRRRAADADHVPHADGRSRPDPHRRADRGPGAQAGRAGRPRCSTRSPGAACRSCWSSRS